ncbi:MAG: diguanylate phosphodiesterase, partial [Brevundimonas sp.]|nr:diguanylate phosphodiesterase [Brevundimonas sp.]
PAEQDVLRDLGVDLMQGYLLARPALEALGLVAWPRAASLARTA